MERLRAAVAGAGVFATYHARKYAELPGAELVGVFDPDAGRAEALAASLKVRAFDTLEAMLADCHVVSVAVPASNHAEVARRAIAANRHVYVEKPLATTLDAGEALVEHAGSRRLVLAVGHQERATFAAMGLLEAPETPHLLRSIRRGTPADRSRDVSCVLDLMIHDLDLLLQLAGDDILSVEASGAFDEVRAEVVFRSGLHATLEASRVAKAKARTMRMDYSTGVVEVDFLAPSSTNTTAFALNPGFADTPQGRDPLGVSLTRFLDAVAGRADRPLATGEEGLAALALALRIEQLAGV